MLLSSGDGPAFVLQVTVGDRGRIQHMANVINRNIGYETSESKLAKKAAHEGLAFERESSPIVTWVFQRGYCLGLLSVKQGAWCIRACVATGTFMLKRTLNVQVTQHRRSIVSDKHRFAEELGTGRRYLEAYIARRLERDEAIPQDYYVVEAIVTHQWVDDEDHTLCYWTKWLGYPHESDSLELEDHL